MKINLYAFLTLLLVILASPLSQATHLRGGYIYYTLDQVNPRKAHFTLKVYNRESSPANDPFARVSMGDGVQVDVKRDTVLAVKPDVVLSTYSWEHTFAAAGTYTVLWVSENRNGQILNIAPPSDQYSLVLTTTIRINPLVPNRHGVDIKTTLPVMAHPNEPLRFNLLAYDLDGDSLGYTLINPLYRDAQGQIAPVPGYKVPDGFGINQFGEIYWENASSNMGAYTFTVQITQYRKGQAVGQTLFDMEFIVHADFTDFNFPKVELENKEELTFLKDGQLLVKPGEQVTLRLRFPHQADVTWQSELQDLGIEDVTIRRIDYWTTEFTITATEALSRRQAYGVNFNFAFRLPYFPRVYVATLTVPILIWQPEEVKLKMLASGNLNYTPEGYISSIPGQDVKVRLFAYNGLGNTVDLSIDSSLKTGAEHFSFVTRDSADSVVGELIFKPSQAQISSQPYTITIRSVSVQLRTSNGSPTTNELVLQVLVSEPVPLSSENELAVGTAKLYPNPATDGFSVEAPDFPSLYLQLHDVHGKTVAGYTLQPGHNEIRRPATLGSGLYFYTLTSRMQPIQNGKLVLQ